MLVLHHHRVDRGVSGRFQPGESLLVLLRACFGRSYGGLRVDVRPRQALPPGYRRMRVRLGARGPYATAAGGVGIVLPWS